MRPLAHIFGVRHLSPAGAHHLERFLEEKDPEVVLIEGPSDATDLIPHLAHKKTAPPVAVLAFTRARPVRSILYPLARYSPEWVAARWALKNKRVVRFMDLPAAVFLEWHVLPDASQEDGNGNGNGNGEEDHTQAYLDDPWDRIAELAGDPDHDTWWERNFEHTTEVAAYRDAAFELGRGLRELELAAPRRARMTTESLVREAYMRREIRAHVKDPDRGVVVCGAFHAPALTDAEPAMTDAERNALPRADSVLTLMPYSYPRLSSQSGYGAGNRAPSYFELLYDEQARGTPARARASYFAAVARGLRQGGQVRSSAEVIEAVRLAEALAAMNDAPAPVLRDLQDAARTLLGQGEQAPITKAQRAVEVGAAVGRLPEGVSQTALQDDFRQLVSTLRLQKFVKDEPQELELDLRQDRFAKTKEGALLDRSRSTFLHRLAVLEVGFGAPAAREQKGTSREKWKVQWTPECEVRLAERSLLADSIEGAAALHLAERLAAAKDTGEATEVVLRAVDCELASALAVALRRVQELAVDEGGFAAAAKGAADLAEVVRYGTVRDVDPAPLRPVLSQLFLRGALLLFDATVCADDARAQVSQGMERLHEVAFLGEEGLEPEPWVEALLQVADSDSRNSYLSGLAAALLIERGRLGDAAIDAEVSRRLSPGTEADVGVGWFEGLVQRNRAALFLRPALWAALARYVDELDADAFRRALLYLRRAFSTFSAGEVRRVVDVLGQAWARAGDPQAAAALAATVETKLDQAELDAAAKDLEGLDLL